LKKTFKLKDDEIRDLAVGYGYCIATDTITVHGKKVGYMYREEPSDEADSGWCFMTGKESEKYMRDDRNLGVYDVNTIANYSPDIIEFLDAPYHSAFERNSEGELVEFEE
jgi:hypothetical protein